MIYIIEGKVVNYACSMRHTVCHVLHVPTWPFWYVIWRKRYKVNKALKTTSEYVLFERLVLDMEVYRSDRSLVSLNIENNYNYKRKFITFWIEPKECTLDTDYMSAFKFHWTPDTDIVILKNKLKSLNKVGCVFLLVVVFTLPHAELGPNPCEITQPGRRTPL